MFCKFLVCHGFDLFFCQPMALLVLPEKKSIRKKKNKSFTLVNLFNIFLFMWKSTAY